MQRKSSDSVKVFFADKQKVTAELKQYADNLRRRRPEVLKVGFFGSYATDNFGPASDVDLIIILRKSDKRFLDRIPEYMPDNLSVGCDCFAYTTDEVERMQRDDNRWLRHILKEVIWL
jgi:predicted nucleotidyltransferase